jgi:hypothetical protein
MLDPIAAALQEARIKAWLAKCATLPPPPPLPMPYRQHDPARHEAAVAAALARGVSSLEEYQTMPRIALQTTPAAPSRARGQCIACDMLSDRAHPAYPVCDRCAAEPDTTRQRLEQRITTAQQRVVNAANEAQSARDALSEADAKKWSKIAAARLAIGRTGRHADTATPEQRVWLAKVQRALDTPTNTQVSDALRLVALADEAHYWIAAGAATAERQARIALAQFEECIEALADAPCTIA